jgi:hypothetical protein
MNRILFTLPLSIAMLACGAALPCAAAVLVGNLDQPTRATTIVPIDQGWAAQSFATGAASEVLSAIDVLVGLRSGTPVVVAELHADSADGPGALLATFSVPLLPSGTPQPVALTPDIAAVLAPFSTYWLVMGTSGAGAFGWSYAQGNASNGPGALGAYAYSPDQGASWSGFGTDNPYQLQVEVSAVPEPANAAMLALGLGLLGVQTWRSRSSGWRVTGMRRTPRRSTA